MTALTDRPRVRLSRRSSFVVVAAALFVVMTAAGAPSPLYVVWAGEIGFSSSTLTVIFAVYVLALLVALLTVGSLSDHIGRKPVLLAALVAEVVAVALFLPADTVVWLLAARVVQGMATGAALGALGAALIDTQAPGGRGGTIVNSVVPPLGLGVGALVAGALVQYAPHPTTLVFWALIAAVVAVGIVTTAVPETTARRPGALRSLQPRMSVHPDLRAAFVAATPIFVATWSVAGLYLSLGGSLTSRVFGHDNHLVGGAVVGAMTTSGALACLLLRAAAPRTAIRLGSATLVVGLAIGLVGLVVATPGAGFAVFLVGTAVTGFGFGSAFVGALSSVMTRVGPDDRAVTLAAVLSVSYLAFAVPAVVAGVVATRISLRDTSIGYAVAVIVVVAAAVALDVAIVRAEARSGDPAVREVAATRR